MGQKTNPVGFRLGYTMPWQSDWVSRKDSGYYLHEDNQIRQYVNSVLAGNGLILGMIRISRRMTKSLILKISVRVSNPNQKPIPESIYTQLQERLSFYTRGTIVLELIAENSSSHKEAQLLANELAMMFEKRKTLNQVKREALRVAQSFNGIKIEFCGRFQGATMARREYIQRGQIPLQTLSVPIDYAFAEAHTQYGVFGIKVWLNHK